MHLLHVEVLFIAYGTRRLEVLAHGGYGAVCQQVGQDSRPLTAFRKAEMALNLHPAAYELHDHCGKALEKHASAIEKLSKSLCRSLLNAF